MTDSYDETDALRAKAKEMAEVLAEVRRCLMKVSASQWGPLIRMINEVLGDEGTEG